MRIIKTIAAATVLVGSLGIAGAASATPNLCMDEFNDGDPLQDCDVIGDPLENGSGPGWSPPPPPPPPTQPE